MGGAASSRPSTAEPADSDNEETREEAVQRVLSLHQQGREHNNTQQFLRHSMSKAKLAVRLQKRKTNANLAALQKSGVRGNIDTEETSNLESPSMFHVVNEKSPKKKKKKKDKKEKKEKKDKKHKKDKKDKKDKKKHKRSKKTVWPQDIPQNGVTIRFLQQLLGRVKPEMSANDVCRDLVKVDTATLQVPYTSMLETEKRCDYHGNSFVGKATHFVSYCQEEPFDQLVSALDVFVNLSGSNPGTVFFWVDIFSLNQHTSFVTITQDWLSTSLPSAIG